MMSSWFDKLTMSGSVAIIGFSLCICMMAPAPSAHANGKSDYELAVAWRAFLDSDSRPRIGVALGGGGARGMAHIGVLRVLGNSGIPVDVVTGTSIGSFVGALYATGADIDKIENLALQTNWSNLIELKMSRVGFFSTRRLERFINFHLMFFQKDILNLPSRRAAEDYLSSDLSDLQFADLKLPFACSATDLYSGSIIVFDSGPVASAVRASCSIPGLFEPVTFNDQLLVDGGILLNLPVSLCRSKGADFVIAVDLESDTPSQITGLVDVLAQIISIQGRAITAPERALAGSIIFPTVGKIKTTELSMTADAIREGQIAAVQDVAGIKREILSRYSKSGIALSSDSAVSSDQASCETGPLDVDELRKVLASVKVPNSTAIRIGQQINLMPAARAAVKLGLDREALAVLALIAPRARTSESFFLQALASIRMRDKKSAEEAVEALQAIDAPGPQALDKDHYWKLAAVALDCRMDDISAAMVAMVARVERVERVAGAARAADGGVGGATIDTKR